MFCVQAGIPEHVERRAAHVRKRGACAGPARARARPPGVPAADVPARNAAAAHAPRRPRLPAGVRAAAARW